MLREEKGQFTLREGYRHVRGSDTQLKRVVWADDNALDALLKPPTSTHSSPPPPGTASLSRVISLSFQ